MRTQTITIMATKTQVEVVGRDHVAATDVSELELTLDLAFGRLYNASKKILYLYPNMKDEMKAYQKLLWVEHAALVKLVKERVEA